MAKLNGATKLATGVDDFNTAEHAVGEPVTGLNDGRWHSVSFTRKGMIISMAIDDEQPLISK